MFIDNEEFNASRDEFIKGKMSAMQKDMDAGRSIDEKTNITERFQKLANIIK